MTHAFAALAASFNRGGWRFSVIVFIDGMPPSDSTPTRARSLNLYQSAFSHAWAFFTIIWIKPFSIGDSRLQGPHPGFLHSSCAISQNATEVVVTGELEKFAFGLG